MNCGQNFMMVLLKMLMGCNNNQHHHGPRRHDDHGQNRNHSIFDNQGGCGCCKNKQKPPKMPPFQGQNRTHNKQRPPKGHGIFDQCQCHHKHRPEPRPINGNWFNSPRPNQFFG